MDSGRKKTTKMVEKDSLYAEEELLDQDESYNFV